MSDSAKHDKPNDDALDEMVERHLRGELTESEQEQLASWLDSDPSLRKDFVQLATWDTELMQAVRSGGNRPIDLDTMLADDRESPQRRTTMIMRSLLAIAATTILVLSFALLNEKSQNDKSENERSNSTAIIADDTSPSIANITGLSGSMIWTGDRGELVRDVQVGTELAGGTIEGLSPDSWFELQFADGSQVTISGASTLTFSDDGQKRLRLREGRMSADVAPQPTGHPMMIQTRSATLTVLGTSFDVEADLPATAVSVREGTVRVTRVSDGKQIDVTANHRVVAAADQNLERTPIAGVVRHWKSNIDQSPNETFGEWIAATDTEPAFLKSVAFVPKQNPDVVLYLLGLGVRSDEGAPVQVDAESRFEIRGKIDIETDIYFGIQVAYANGDFAGKFRAKCDVQRGATGDFVATADLTDFILDPSVAEYKDKLAPSPDGLSVNGVWSFTHSSQPSGLRISKVELSDAR